MPVAGVEAPLVSTLIPLARSNVIFLHCLLCLTASQLTLAHGVTKPQPCEMYHRGEAFKLLREALSDPEKATSDDTVACIVTLSGHDVRQLFGICTRVLTSPLGYFRPS